MKKKSLKIISALCMAIIMLSGSVSAYAADAYNPPIIEVKSGKLRGYLNKGTYVFAGVQYATAERFGMPQPVEPWTGIKDAQTYGPVCPVPIQSTVSNDEFVWPHRYWVESENCQFLNIWTQQLDTNAKKPVMVFMHGGGQTNGSSIESYAYDGRNLSEYGDVVTVTLNHRLNVLGFLNLSEYGEEYANSANVSTADLVAALQWIHDNIEYFGGDPGNVTIFGQSGGSNKVVTLMHTPSAKGLFHKVIAESTGYVAGYNSVSNSKRMGEETLRILGLDGTEIDELKKVPYYKLLDAAGAAMSAVNKEPGRSISYGPTADEKFIMSDFCDWSADIPFIAGTNFSERTGTLHIGDGRKNEWTEEETYANLVDRYGDNADAIIAEFKRLFPGRNIADVYFYATTYRSNVRKGLEAKMKSGNALVYNYLFDYEAPVNGGITPFHCAELIYVFHNVDMPQLRIATGANKDAYTVQDTVAKAWVNFAYTGNPSQDGLVWKPYSETNETMIFDVKSECRLLDDLPMVNLILKALNLS